MPAESQFITAKDIAADLAISLWTAYEIIHCMPYIQIGRIYRVRKAVYEDWKHKQEVRNRK